MPMERPFSESDWLATPEPVRRYVEALEQRIEKLEASHAQVHKRIEQLESRMNRTRKIPANRLPPIHPISGRSGREENPSGAGALRKATKGIGNRCSSQPKS